MALQPMFQLVQLLLGSSAYTAYIMGFRAIHKTKPNPAQLACTKNVYSDPYLCQTCCHFGFLSTYENKVLINSSSRRVQLQLLAGEHLPQPEDAPVNLLK